MITNFDTTGTDNDKTREEAMKFIRNVDREPLIIQDTLEKLKNANQSTQEDQVTPSETVTIESTPVIELPPPRTSAEEPLKEKSMVEQIKSMSPQEKIIFAREMINIFCEQEGITLEELAALEEEENEEENLNFIQRYGGSIGTIAFCLVLYKLMKSDDPSVSIEMTENMSALESLFSGR